MSLASVTQAQANTAAAASAAPAGTASSNTASTAMASLTTDFNSFLQMLMTQLQNQDPTSPTDTAQFTSELVQFSQVEQQINTNSNLTSLIQLTQGDQLLQGSSMVGHTVTATSNQVDVQGGTAQLGYTAAVAGPVNITITNSAGLTLANTTVNAQAGNNNWTWNGQDENGNQVSDGAYNVVVTGASATGTTTQLPTSITATATGVSEQNNAMELMLGSMPISFSSVTSVN